ncbi:hypothetical protein VKT23_018584 [Stygiomarasmius scandens]|uniref:Uncharacterized protein n=1 Tax=Marasmiellus scandens TaxID=2682957 RepID=A0ABR1ISZ3_9AGAR
MDSDHYNSWLNSYGLLPSQGSPNHYSLSNTNGALPTLAYNTSDTRARSSSVPTVTPIDTCNSCSMYCCKNDDKKFLQAMEEGHQDYQRWFEWLWYCIDRAAPKSYRKSERLPVWRSLIDSDDIWLMWGDEDELSLPEAPEVHQLEPSLGPLGLGQKDWESATRLISIRTDLHSQGRCSFAPLPSFLKEIQKMPLQMRLAIILWKSLLACRRVKYPFNPSSLDCEIPYLVPHWWRMIPDSIKEGNAFHINKHSWGEFSDGLKWRGHTCYESHPEKYMWQVWVTIQDILHTMIPIDFPLKCANCEQCIKIQKIPVGRAEPPKPHIVLLWCLLMGSGIFQWGVFWIPFVNPTEYPQGCFSIPSFSTHIFQKGDLAKNLLHPATLEKVDKWFNSLETREEEEEEEEEEEDGMKSDTFFGQALQDIIANSQLLPIWWLEGLEENEKSLDPHWTELEITIFNIQNASSHSASHPKESFHPASWMCAVILFTVVKSVGFGSLSSYIFNQILCGGIGRIVGLATSPVKSPIIQKFQNGLKKSGHTCWSDKLHGNYSKADLYCSAYSMLLDTSHVPIVGCDQANYKQESCAVCCTNNTFQNLSNLDFLDSVDIAQTASLNGSRQEGKLRNSTKRLIYKLNFSKYNNWILGKSPKLHRNNLEGLHKALNALTNHVQYALENATSLGLFDKKDEIDLGYIWNTKGGPEPDDDDEEEEEGEGEGDGSDSSSQTVPSNNDNHQIDQNPSTSIHDVTHTAAAVPLQTAPHTRTEEAPPHINQPFNENVNFYPNNFGNHHFGDLIPFDPTPAPQPAMGYQSSSGSYQQEISQTHFTPPQPDLFQNMGGVAHSEPLVPTSRPASFPQSSQPTATDDTNNQLPLSNSTFIQETGRSGDSRIPSRVPNQPQKLRVDVKRNKIKEKLVSMLKEHNVDTHDRLPWKDLFPFVQRHGLEIQNWPEHIEKPQTHNGIHKAPQEEVKAIYDALFVKEPPLHMTICKKGINPIFVNPSGSGSRDKGKKRARDEDEGQSEGDEERALNRRRT